MKAVDFSDLNGKVCVITGGTGVLGQAMSEVLAAKGVNLAIIGRDQRKTQALADKLRTTYSATCIGVQGDVTDKESLIRARGIINEKLGHIELLVNGAGGNAPKATTRIEQISGTDGIDLNGTFFGLDMEGFDQVFALNFTGTLLATLVFAREMVERRKGVILNISSMNSIRPLTKIPAYSAAKASVNNFTQWLAVHLARTGVRVNAIAPGFFMTEQNRFLLMDETGRPSARGEKIIAGTPVGKYGQPEDLQGAVLFLLSEASSFITGVVLPVDGGFSAYGGV